MQETPKVLQYYKRSILMGALAGALLSLVFVAGFLLRGFVNLPTALAATNSSASDYALLDEVQSLLNRYYLREQPSPKEREYAAIRGLVSALNDRFTFFIDPPVAKSESDVLAGTYGGIGVLVQRSEKGDLVLYPFDDSPAKKIGIEDGDILRAVNNTPVDLSQPADSIDQMLRGEVKEGSGVELTIFKVSTQKEIITFIPFAVINVPSVVWRVLPENKQIGYAQILRFTSRTPDELKTGLTELRKANITALVLDLRNNSGGLLQESVAVASQFLDAGVIVYERSNKDEQALNADSGGLATDWPLVVLVNKGTASAAELVAGAIQDRNRGILIGQTTFGKGTVQQIFRLSDNSSLHVTAAEWLTPNRHHLDGTGLEPTIAMIPDTNGRDVELGEAVRQLQQKLQKQGS
jgi:carboxyl-terminal processing protease